MTEIIIDDNLTKVIVGVCTSLIIAFLLYLTGEVRKLVHLIERHEKVLFGDSDISEWEGLVKMAISSKKYSITQRRTFIVLMQILCRNNVIKCDDELTEAMSALKRDD